MAYISDIDKTKVKKIQVGTNNGNPIYREGLEVYCNNCNDSFPIDNISMGIEFKDEVATKIKCPNCNKFLK